MFYLRNLQQKPKCIDFKFAFSKPLYPLWVTFVCYILNQVCQVKKNSLGIVSLNSFDTHIQYLRDILFTEPTLTKFRRCNGLKCDFLISFVIRF